MAKYNKEMLDKIVAFLQHDSYSIFELCRMLNISRSNFYLWLKKYPEFSEAVENAKKVFHETMLVECSRSLRKLIVGYKTKEKKTVSVDSGKTDENGNPIPKILNQTVVEKNIPPNLGAIIHYQTNRDPDNWKNKQSKDDDVNMSQKTITFEINKTTPPEILETIEAAKKEL